MSWTPIAEGELLNLINIAWEKMSMEQRRFWDVIKIAPIKWDLSPYGDLGCGFWIVAIYGSHVIWFNDIEDGFNISHWSKFGSIDEYWCNQDELQWTVQSAMNHFSGDHTSTFNRSSPLP